jgi:hypothetical protein
MPSLPCYGRPYAFALECPTCTELVLIRSPTRAVSTTKVDVPPGRIWQPLASPQKRGMSGSTRGDGRIASRCARAMSPGGRGARGTDVGRLTS